MTKKITPAEWKISPELAETVETILAAAPHDTDDRQRMLAKACAAIATNLIFDKAASRNDVDIAEVAADLDDGLSAFGLAMNNLGAHRLMEAPGFKTCNTCRYWSELIFRAGGGTDNAAGDTEALCLGAGPNNGQYTTAQKTCPAWAINSHGRLMIRTPPTIQRRRSSEG